MDCHERGRETLLWVCASAFDKFVAILFAFFLRCVAGEGAQVV